ENQKRKRCQDRVRACVSRFDARDDRPAEPADRATGVTDVFSVLCSTIARYHAVTSVNPRLLRVEASVSGVATGHCDGAARGSREPSPCPCVSVLKLL